MEWGVSVLGLSKRAGTSFQPVESTNLKYSQHLAEPENSVSNNEVTNQPGSIRKNYRSEIDGLRTIAILSVVFYHANFFINGKNVIPGGFIGVDIFFVISGYLISSILITGIKNNNFSYLKFYERRARRILPILLLVMTVSLPFAWKVLLPVDFADFSYQLLTGIFSSSNFYFWLEDPYWATESSLKPFLHTWTLGVEEQFYLLMPVLLLAILRFKKNNLFYWLLGFLVISLVYAQWTSLTDPQESFYLLPSRAWELMAGACLASIAPSARSSDKSLTNHLPSIGVVLLLFSVFWFDKNTLHPSFYTLIPIVGTMLVIQFANDADFSIKMLKSRLFVAVGLISYGLYVWHFPVFAYTNISGGFDGFGLKILLVLGVIAISAASYYVIEKPFRNFTLVPSRIFFTLLVVWIAAISIFSYFGTIDGYKHRVPGFLNQPAMPEAVANHRWFHTPGERNGRIILAGDSHTHALAPSLKKWALDNGYDFANSSIDGCQLLVDTFRVNKKNLRRKVHCTPLIQAARINFITRSRPSIVILGGRLPLILEEDRFDNKEGGYEGEMTDFIQNAGSTLMSRQERQQFIKEKYLKTVRMILAAGHQVVLIYPIPEVGWHVPKTLLKRVGGDFLHAREIAKNNPVTTSYDVFKQRTLSSYQLLDDIRGKRIYRVLPEHLFCNTVIPDRCITHNQEVSYYLDENHLSSDGDQLLIGEIEKLLQKLQDQNGNDAGRASRE